MCLYILRLKRLVGHSSRICGWRPWWWKLVISGGLRALKQWQTRRVRQTIIDVVLIHSFIHSFRPFCSASSSLLLLRSAPDTARILCRSFTPKRHRQLWVKDLHKVPTWQLERESNPWPSGWKLSTQPMRHRVPPTRCWSWTAVCRA